MTTINNKYKTINKYNKRAANANKMHKLNHAGYLLILLSMLPDKIRKKFEFKPGTFEQTTLITLLLSFIKENYDSQKVEEFFFSNGLCRATYIEHRSRGTKLGLYVQNSNRTYTITDKGHEVIAFACRTSIRGVAVLKVLLDDYVTESPELFV
jgi:hypothetical protein